MPYCPQCKRDIEEDLVHCPHCGTPLVMGSSVESETNEDNVEAVLLLRADSSLQAELLVSALDDEGISYLAKGMGITDGLGGVAGGDVRRGAFSSTQGIEIWVNPHDLPRAKELLAEQSGQELPDDASVDEEGGDSGGSSGGSSLA